MLDLKRAILGHFDPSKMGKNGDFEILYITNLWSVPKSPQTKFQVIWIKNGGGDTFFQSKFNILRKWHFCLKEGFNHNF